MANQRISELTQLVTASGSEYIECIIPPFNPGTNRKLLISAITGADLTRVSVSVITGTMTLDLDNKQQRKFEDTTAISSNFILAFDNETVAEVFTLIILITGTVVITMPSTVVTLKGDSRWSNGAKTLTLTGGTAEPFELSFSTMDGPAYILKASGVNYAP